MVLVISAVQPPQSRFRDLEAYLTTQLRLDQIPLELRTSCTRVTEATFLVLMSATMEKDGTGATGPSERVQLVGRVRRPDGRIVELFDGEFSESAPYEDTLVLRLGIHTLQVAVRAVHTGKVSIREEALNLTCE